MMNKNSVKGYAILGILFALVSVVVFAVPTAKAPAFWIAYGFTVVAFAVQPFIWKLALGREKSLKSKFLRFPVIYIAVVYLAIQLITLIVLGSSPTLPIWSSIVACVVVTGVSAICMITADTGRCEIERVETKAQKKVFYIKEIQAEIELLADAETNAETKAALIRLAEKVRFSDPMSSEQLTDLENAISEKVALLKTLSDKNEIIGEIDLLLSKRNKMCKTLK